MHSSVLWTYVCCEGWMNACSWLLTGWSLPIPCILAQEKLFFCWTRTRFALLLASSLSSSRIFMLYSSTFGTRLFFKYSSFLRATSTQSSAAAMGFATEFQGDGTSHGHGFVSLSNMYQHCTCLSSSGASLSDESLASLTRSSSKRVRICYRILN